MSLEGESILNREQKGIHVVLVNTWRVINSKGGTEKVFCDMANALSLMGYKVTAMCVDPYPGAPGFELSSSVRFVNAGRLGKPLFRRGIFKLIRTFSLDSDKRKINKEINELKWRAYLLKKEINCIRSADICISFQLETTYMLSQMLCVEAPIITMFHQEPKVLLDKYPLEINCSALKISSAVVVLLPSYISQIKNICSEASVVAIPNALPIFERTSTLRKKRLCV